MPQSEPPASALSRQSFLRLGACTAGAALAAPAVLAATPADALGPAAPEGREATDDLLHGTSSFPGNDGRAHTVTWDEHSFFVDDQRLLIYSGEIHPWRVPAPAQWRDLLQIVKAAGFTAVSFYFFWGLHQSAPGGDFDFRGIRDLDLLLTMAAEEGLYVIARPGPYVNAEISMGGLPAYLTNRAAPLRSMDPENFADSCAWLSAANEIISRHQVTDGGGSVLMYQVENELFAENPESSAFLRGLADHVRSTGITVPVFHNDYGLGGRFADTEKHHTDFYAYDNYPLGFNAGGPRARIGESEQTYREISPDTPQFITESQGGAFTPWGASFDSHQAYEFTDPAFTRQWGVRNLANGVTAFNYYMVFGGTNWGYTGSPSSGFTSYDYGAAITEDRELTEKLAVQKELGYLQQALPQIASMTPVAPQALREVDGGQLQAYQRASTGDESSATDDGRPRLLAFRLADSNDETDTRFATALVLGDPEEAGAHAPTADDRDAAITYQGDWEQIEDPTASAATLTRTETAGATASWTFTGTAVDVITATGTDHGRARVLVDGQEHGTFTSHVDTAQNKPSQVVSYQVHDLSAGEHTIVVEALGEPAEGAEGTVVALDGFDVPAGGQDGSVEIPEGVVGWARVPQDESTFLHLHGRDALTVVADTVIGDHGLLYSTSALFGPALPRRKGHLQYLIGHDGDPGEIVLRYAAEPEVTAPESVLTTWDEGTGQLRINLVHGDQPVQVEIAGRPLTSAGSGGKSRLVLRAISRTAATTTWFLGGRPVNRSTVTPGGTDAHVVVEGAELARTVAFARADAEIVLGSTDLAEVRLDVPDGIRRVIVNGQSRPVSDGIATHTLSAPAGPTVPDLTFRVAEGAPEAAADFDDSAWTVADSTEGSTTFQGPGRGGVVLDSNHYGYFEGSIWYRAVFTAGESRELVLRGNGGTGQPPQGQQPAFLQAWADGSYLGAAPAVGKDQTFTLPEDVAVPGATTVLSVLVHNLGQNLDWSDNGLSKQNRGLFDAVLPATGEITWRVQGAADIDSRRTLYNTGGLHGERHGWHLPGHDDSAWEEASSLVADAPGVRWYRTSFELSTPDGVDIAWRFALRSPRFEDGRRDACQAVLYVNGWNTGIYIGDIGPQSEFTIPSGFLDHHGPNTLAVWVAAKEAGAGPETIELVPVFARTGSIGTAPPLL
ncbi:beta-galactosidase [Brachybacterium vulturis]|uniref:beta-galactosidase n=1 Tax=Brachybacterium vulturis TaxID=2017484 RepID=A0A291GKC3_9MICO|nr:beta-galactosidase [Brachybacterium vulturis]ATG50424.1 beta-galactosidase [Brachybacterium vulturis]